MIEKLVATFGCTFMLSVVVLMWVVAFAFRAADTWWLRLWRWTVTLAAAALILVVLVGCVQPGAARVTVLDEAGVQAVIDGVKDTLPQEPAPWDEPLYIGAGSLAVIVHRIWFHKRNGKNK